MTLDILNGRHTLAQRQDIRYRPKWSDTQWVDLGVRFGVMVLYVQEIGGVLECYVIPVEVPHPCVDGRVTGTDIAKVALEVLDVDGLLFSPPQKSASHHSYIIERVGFVGNLHQT